MLGRCHVNLTSSHGVIRYPSDQGPLMCQWLIDRGPGYYTKITVDYFSLKNNYTKCDINHVKVRQFRPFSYVKDLQTV